MLMIKVLNLGMIQWGLKYEISAIFPLGNIQTKIREKEFKPLTDCWATVISGTFKYNKVNNVEIPIEKMI